MCDFILLKDSAYNNQKVRATHELTFFTPYTPAPVVTMRTITFIIAPAFALVVIVASCSCMRTLMIFYAIVRKFRLALDHFSIIISHANF